MAEGVMRRLAAEAGLSHLECDSAGTHGYHVGESPDPRAVAAAARRGYDLSDLRARQITAADFEDFDLILAMDFNNLGVLQNLCPVQYRSKLGMFMSYGRRFNAVVVQDPYYRDSAAFELALDYIEDACEGLAHLLAAKTQAVG
jgi:protein-tyrosine phosphatase